MLVRVLLYVTELTLAVGIRSASAAALSADTKQSDPTPAADATVCEIAASPEAFDGKLLRIHAYISRGFEDSTLHDPSCPEEALVNWRGSSTPVPKIWSDFANEVGYWKVKGYAPLVKDDQLRLFRRLLDERSRTHQMTGATMTGTFYSGKPLKVNGRATTLRGYGHMGCCSLFVISTVESVDTDYANDLNYSAGDWNVGLPLGCTSEQMLGLPTNEMLLAWQQAANQGQDEWRYDAKQTAEDQLRKLKSGSFGSTSGGTTRLLVPGKSDLSAPADSRPAETLLETASTTFLKRFEWIEGDQTAHFVIVVTRPYWLLKTAGTPERVIWAPAAASVLNCQTPRTRNKKR